MSQRNLKRYPILLLISRILRAPRVRTPTDWARENYILPPESAEPGPYRPERTPYLIPVAKATMNPKYRMIVFVSGAQMGKTTLTFIVLGHRLDDDPVPMLFISSTQKLAKSISKDRIMKMIKNCPSLWEKLAKGKDNKIEEKFFDGVRVGFGWASSATELASHPVGIVFIDERDRMDSDVDGEGDPVELAMARTKTFPDGKVIVTSTPTIEGASPIWALWEEGTQHQWAWPCPECNEYFVPKFELLKWPEGASPSQAQRKCWVECPNCGFHITERYKKSMNEKGKYITEKNEPNTTASFWVSGLASPWQSWGDAARAFLVAKRSNEPGRVQGVINTVFGEPYKVEGEAPDWQEVANLRQPYSFGEIPPGVIILTCGVDVGKDRLFYAIRGWGKHMESWLIEHGEIFGEVEQPKVWHDLENLLNRPFIAGNDKLLIKLMLIDSGYQADMVYSFCLKNPQRALPAKGHKERNKPVSPSKIHYKGSGIQLWHIHDGYFKAWIHGRIRRPEDEPGAWHLSIDATDDYCQQLVAEQLLIKPNGTTVWIKTRKANHYLDAEKLNVAAAYILNLHLLEAAEETKKRIIKRRRIISKGVTSPYE